MAQVVVERRSRQIKKAPNGAQYIRHVVAVERVESPQPRLRRQMAVVAEITESRHLAGNCWGIPASVNAFFERRGR